MKAQSGATKRMAAARTALVLDQPFWGTLALRLQLAEDPTCKTAWVDGKTLGFNPQYVEGLPTAAAVTALVAHEVSHCVFGHPWRRDGREFKRWNQACDRAINPVLRDSGFALPDNFLFELEPSHHGKSAEWIFNRMPQPKPSGGDGEGEGSEGEGDEGSSSEGSPDNKQDDGDEGEGSDEGAGEDQDKPGEVRDAPAATEDTAEDTTGEEDAWKQAVRQAAQMADSQGKLPGGLKRELDKVAQARVDWRSVLRRFSQEAARSDYSWSTPNRRYLALGLYLPALCNREMGPLVIGVDTSGSIDDTLLALFAAEIQSVVEETQPRRTHVVYCDARVQRVDVFERGDPVVLHHAGGGGTNFRPLFQMLDTLEEPAVCVVYLTDLYGTFPAEDPGVPTLWACPQRHSQSAVPFGEVMAIED